MAISYIALIDDTQAASLAAASPEHSSLTQLDSQLTIAHHGADLLAQTGTQAQMVFDDDDNKEKMMAFGRAFKALLENSPADINASRARADALRRQFKTLSTGGEPLTKFIEKQAKSDHIDEEEDDWRQTREAQIMIFKDDKLLAKALKAMSDGTASLTQTSDAVKKAANLLY